MDAADYEHRLSRIATRWTRLLEAHLSNSPDASSARAELVQRYLGAVYRYLLAIVRDADVADELCQEFAVKFLAGDFHRAQPERGRFRDYVKTVVVNLVRSRARQIARQPLQLPDQLAGHAGDDDQDETFSREWQREVLEQTWQALLRDRANYYHVLKLRVENPDLTSRELAERFSQEQQQPMTPANIRKTLERAHQRFANLLIAEVAASLDDDSAEQVRAELQELDLLKYCRKAFDEWAARQ